MIELSHQFAVMVVEKQSSHISNLYLKAKMSIYYVRFNLHHLSIKRQNMYFSKYALGNLDILQFKVKQYILNILGYGTELHCSARFQSTFRVLHHYIILFQGNIRYPFFSSLVCGLLDWKNCLWAYLRRTKLYACIEGRKTLGENNYAYKCIFIKRYCPQLLVALAVNYNIN